MRVEIDEMPGFNMIYSKAKNIKVNKDEQLVSYYSSEKAIKKLMTKLRNHNIISIFEYYMNKNEDEIIIMEKGKMDLKDFQINLLKRSVLSETFLCYVAYQVLEGLKYLHRCNIIHYDIKPNNVV